MITKADYIMTRLSLEKKKDIESTGKSIWSAYDCFHKYIEMVDFACSLEFSIHSLTKLESTRVLE